MTFVFIPGKRTTDALFVVRKMQENYGGKEQKLHVFLWTLRRHLIEFQDR